MRLSSASGTLQSAVVSRDGTVGSLSDPAAAALLGRVEAQLGSLAQRYAALGRRVDELGNRYFKLQLYNVLLNL